ncbi:MAG: tRNA 2-thiouridine(34) synthase MnmA [Actinomycetota bacterium]|nr:tRNA 2-thiouridine(34) synthase MnmA [Actinomycetota bacterium]
MRVVAAMSGGVDSSVAAARLVDAGHDVVGIHLALSRKSSSGRGCCTLDDARDARRVADMLGIAFYVWDLSEQFAADVVDDFLAEYRSGRTPNPCMRCNERIKFAAVLDRAVALGFDAVATGHYARVVPGTGGPELHRAVDAAKDQSYVLGVLGVEQLGRTILPLGGDLKGEVRAEAARRGLLVAAKPDSHDICFIPDGDTAAFLRSRLGDQPGDIVDERTGAVVATHSGAYAFTIGQRRGLGITVATEDAQPRYVVGIDIDARTVSVGPPALLDVDVAEGIRPTWAGPAVGERPVELAAQVRAHAEPVAASARLVDERLMVEFHTPIRGLAPGQSMVLYDGTRVVGSATVDVTHRMRVA